MSALTMPQKTGCVAGIEPSRSVIWIETLRFGRGRPGCSVQIYICLITLVYTPVATCPHDSNILFIFIPFASTLPGSVKNKIITYRHRMCSVLNLGLSNCPRHPSGCSQASFMHTFVHSQLQGVIKTHSDKVLNLPLGFFIAIEIQSSSLYNDLQ